MIRMNRLCADILEACSYSCDLHCLLGAKHKPIPLERIAGQLSSVKHECYEPGETICYRGQQCESIVSIRSGLVKLVETLENGMQRIILLAGGGMPFVLRPS